MTWVLTRQTVYVTLRRVHESSMQWKSNTYYMCVCVCVCVRARLHVVLHIQHTTRMRYTVTSFVAPLAPPHFSTLSHKRHDIRKKDTEHKMCA
jgi:hypothetical protein